MTTSLAVRTVSPFDAIRREDVIGEYWLARELIDLLGYDSWRRFEETIERAMIAVNNAGMEAPDHIADAVKKVDLGSGAQRSITDYRLSRFGAYMVAMNGDPRKPEIAEAQTYFAVRTREAEVSPRFEIPADYPSALRAAAAQAERAALAESKVAELAPKAETFDAFLSSVGDYSVNEAAKILARDNNILTGQGRLFTFMQGLGWIYRDAKGRPIPYQAQVDAGRLAARAQFHFHPETGERIPDPPQIRVTAKGLAALRHKYLAVSS